MWLPNLILMPVVIELLLRTFWEKSIIRWIFRLRKRSSAATLPTE